MKKLLLTLICLFMSFEVKSEERYDNVDMKDCLQYLDKGKVLHKVESGNNNYFKVITVFSYKQKTYEHILIFVYMINGLKSLDDSYCNVFDFDIKRKSILDFDNKKKKSK